MVKPPRFRKRGMLLRPHQQAEVNWSDCALSKPPLQPCSAGSGRKTADSVRTCRLPGLLCLAAESTDHLEAGSAPARTHSQPSARCEPSCPGNPWPFVCLPGLCHLITFCCSYVGPTLGCYLSKHLLGKLQSLICLHNHPPRPGGIISSCDRCGK